MSLTGRAEKLIISLASLCFASVALADEHAGSVRVRIIRLEKVPEEWKSNSLAVRALIGSRFLYQTPYRGGLTPRWNNGLRMFTAHSLPMVFRVVEPGARARAVRDTRRRPSAKKQTRSDEILATGMDELVADFGPSPSGKDGEPGPTVAEGPQYLAWPELFVKLAVLGMSLFPRPLPSSGLPPITAG